MSEIETRKQPATWRIITAAILNFFTAFFVIGYIIAWFTGGITNNGFQLNGWPALLSFALIVAYFMTFNRLFKGTIWKHILSAQR